MRHCTTTSTVLIIPSFRPLLWLLLDATALSSLGLEIRDCFTTAAGIVVRDVSEPHPQTLAHARDRVLRAPRMAAQHQSYVVRHYDGYCDVQSGLEGGLR
jgi:hypothetical protein